MEKNRPRYPLIIYSRMINLWWPAILVLGLSLIGLALLLYSRGVEQWRWLGMASVGGLNVFIGLLLRILNTSAFVQVFKDHLRLATPFLRLKISYKRILRTYSTNLSELFPPKSLSKWQAEIIQPVASQPVIVIELNALPLSQSALRLFLSPLFFKDKTPHLIILVKDWMHFSAELESMRAGLTSTDSGKNQGQSILSRLPGNK